MDIIFRKVVVVSVIVNMSILKSPIINVGFFVLDSLCSIACIYSLNKELLISFLTILKIRLNAIV